MQYRDRIFTTFRLTVESPTVWATVLKDSTSTCLVYFLTSKCPRHQPLAKYTLILQQLALHPDLQVGGVTWALCNCTAD